MRSFRSAMYSFFELVMAYNYNLISASERSAACKCVIDQTGRSLHSLGAIRSLFKKWYLGEPCVGILLAGKKQEWYNVASKPSHLIGNVGSIEAIFAKAICVCRPMLQKEGCFYSMLDEFDQETSWYYEENLSSNPIDEPIARTKLDLLQPVVKLVVPDSVRGLHRVLNSHTEESEKLPDINFKMENK